MKEEQSLAEQQNAEGQRSLSEEQNLEELFGQLEELVAKLEEPSISLEESFRAYEEGVRLLRACNEKIDRVEKQVLVLNEEGGLSEFSG